MNKEVEGATEYLMLMKDKLDFNKYGFVYGAESIDTVLKALDSSIPKEKIKKEIEKRNIQSKEHKDKVILTIIEREKNVLKGLLEGKC